MKKKELERLHDYVYYLIDEIDRLVYKDYYLINKNNTEIIQYALLDYYKENKGASITSRELEKLYRERINQLKEISSVKLKYKINEFNEGVDWIDDELNKKKFFNILKRKFSDCNVILSDKEDRLLNIVRGEPKFRGSRIPTSGLKNLIKSGWILLDDSGKFVLTKEGQEKLDKLGELIPTTSEHSGSERSEEDTDIPLLLSNISKEVLFKLSKRQKILLHLYKANSNRYKDKFDAPITLSREGIAKSIGYDERNLAKILGEMKGNEKKGIAALIKEDKEKHIFGKVRRSYTYFLTNRGINIAHTIEESIKKEMK